MDKDRQRIQEILEKNANKNFVKRILYPKQYPILPRPDLGKDAYSTHLMSYSTDSDGAFVYPRVIQDNSGSLQMLRPDTAARHAMSTGEMIRFDTPDEAEWFSKNYKKVWEPIEGK